MWLTSSYETRRFVQNFCLLALKVKLAIRALATPTFILCMVGTMLLQNVSTSFRPSFQDPKAAAALWEKATDTLICEDRTKEAGEHLAKAARLHVKAGDLEAALPRLDRSVALMHEAGKAWTAGRTVVAMVLVHLALGDAVAANKAFQKWGGYCDSDQVRQLLKRGLQT